MRVAVVGAGGQLGAAIVQQFQARHDVTALDREALDIANAETVAAVMAEAAPDAILNCAAYNMVDAAEEHPVDALQVNAIAVRSLARAATALDAMFVHYSSDFVFDGNTTTPYTEADRPNPRSVYAASKLMGEWFALDAPRAYVLRVESLFGRAASGPPSKGSVSTIVHNLLAGRTARVFSDRTVSPTYIPDAAIATAVLLERGAAPGLYHCVNSGRCTWLEFAREAARLLGIEASLEAVSVADVKLRAERPRYCALSNAKLVAAGAEMPAWTDALERYLASTTTLLNREA